MTTVTVIGAEVVVLAAASRARAVSVWPPLITNVVFQLTSYGAARELIRETGNEPVPMHLRNAVSGLMKSMGYGKDYKYAHDAESGVADQVHMPERLKRRKVYVPNPRDRSPSPAKREQSVSPDPHRRSARRVGERGEKEPK